MNSVEQNLKNIKELISHYEQQYKREKDSVQLLAASKSQSVERIEQAFHCGQSLFGENYLQEAIEKMQALSQYKIEWHFIGSIQSNKTKKIANHFSWVQSVNSIKIARRLNEARSKELPPLNICLEVNVNQEKSKSGIDSQHLFSLAEYCASLPHLKLRGLMSIPFPHQDVNEQRQSFHRLFLIYQALRSQGFPLDTLSMGMTDDFEAAIAEGSTLVRIGTGIFGSRD